MEGSCEREEGVVAYGRIRRVGTARPEEPAARWWRHRRQRRRLTVGSCACGYNEGEEHSEVEEAEGPEGAKSHWHPQPGSVQSCGQPGEFRTVFIIREHQFS
jgi:hypothetical protein